VVVVNKWDAVPNKETNTLRDYEADLKAQLRPIDWALVVFTSATTGQRVPRILDAVAAAAEQHRCSRLQGKRQR
jgi:GTP-binding protein